MYKKHIELIEAVNNAKTQQEHDRAEAVLEGFRLALDEFNGRWSGTACDQHYMDQGIERPMCCGVFLDWKPADVAPPFPRGTPLPALELPIIGVINVDNPRDPRHKEWKL